MPDKAASVECPACRLRCLIEHPFARVLLTCAWCGARYFPYRPAWEPPR